MRVLAIDTALEACAAAVLDTTASGQAGNGPAANGLAPNELAASETRAMARGHAEALMPLIARVMAAARLEFTQIDRIAVTTGPGSFTGVRVGIAAARGIALAADKPAVGLSTLAAFAAPHIAAGWVGNVMAVIDARHAHVYVQIFGAGGRSLVPAHLASLNDAVRAAIAGTTLVVGTAAEMLAAAWPAGEPPPTIIARAAPPIDWVARLGAAADAERAPPKPLYLRRPDARPQHAGTLPRR